MIGADQAFPVAPTNTIHLFTYSPNRDRHGQSVSFGSVDPSLVFRGIRGENLDEIVDIRIESLRRPRQILGRAGHLYGIAATCNKPRVISAIFSKTWSRLVETALALEEISRVAAAHWSVGGSNGKLADGIRKPLRVANVTGVETNVIDVG